MSGLYKIFLDKFAPAYQKVMSRRLRAYGLAAEDLLVEKPAVKKALTRIDSSVRVEREQRIMRAFDLSLKRKNLAPEVAASYDPLKLYLNKQLELTQNEELEKIIIRN